MNLRLQTREIIKPRTSVELACVVEYNEKVGTSDQSAMVGFLA
jgi:hypothetical protein